MVIKGTGLKCVPTNIRINLRNLSLVDIRCPNMNIDGFDYTENFDGIQYFGNIKVFINFKCIVGTGGSQTRSLREVYSFIKGQMSISNVYFANILDGDEAHKCLPKYQYLLSTHQGNNIYVGDLKGYFQWFKNKFQ